MVKKFSNYIKENSYIIEDSKKIFANFFSNNDIDKWLYENFEDYCIKNNIEENFSLNEYEFYRLKYTNNSEKDFNIPKYFVYQYFLYENLCSSKILDEKTLNKLENISYIESVKLLGNKNTKCEIVVKDFETHQKEIESLLNFYNYFIQSYKNVGDFTILIVQGRKPKEIDSNNFRYGYHITTKRNWLKIQKYGLIPKHKSTFEEYPSRIYMFIDNNDRLSKKDLEGFKMYGRMMNRVNGMNMNDIVILQIDLKKFNKDHFETSKGEKHPYDKMKLFGDPSSTSSKTCFTLEPIQTKYIKEYKENE